MSSRITAVALALTATTLLAACDDSEIRTGPVRTETRQVSDFNTIEVDGATRLEITVGVPASLEVEGRDPFVGRLETEVDGDTLHIKSRRKDWVTIGTSPRLIIRIGVPRLEKLDVDGGNDIRLRGFNGGATKVELRGATNLTGSGNLDELKIFMAGAGHADLSELVARSASVTVAGVGSVFVHPLDSLDATMNGVGAIYYAGSPRHVNTRMNGLGTIGQRGGADAHASPAPEPVDPDSLQPEYDPRKPEDKQPTKDLTEVI